jgi:hypothetical protein
MPYVKEKLRPGVSDTRRKTDPVNLMQAGKIFGPVIANLESEGVRLHNFTLEDKTVVKHTFFRLM